MGSMISQHVLQLLADRTAGHGTLVREQDGAWEPQVVKIIVV